MMTVISMWVCMGIAGLYAVLLGVGMISVKYREEREPRELLIWVTLPGYVCLDVLKFPGAYPHAFSQMTRRFALLADERHTVEASKRHAARLVSIMWGLLFLGFALSAGDPQPIYPAVSALIVILLPFLSVRRLDRLLELRRRRMLKDLPDVLDQVALLVGAGATVQHAIIRTAERGNEAPGSPLLAEWKQVSRQLQNRDPFPEVMEAFGRRCGIHEIRIFTTTLLLNYRRGGEACSAAVQELSRTLWESRKAMARTLGEEASSKLVFPMVVIFLVILVLVAAPAMMLMNT